MSNSKDAIDHPYDWVEMGYSITREDISGKPTRVMPPDAVIHDADLLDLMRGETNPYPLARPGYNPYANAYANLESGAWIRPDTSTQGYNVRILSDCEVDEFGAHVKTFFDGPPPDDLYGNPSADPWVNGRYALASIVWGLIALLVLGVGAGP